MRIIAASGSNSGIKARNPPQLGFWFLAHPGGQSGLNPEVRGTTALKFTGIARQLGYEGRGSPEAPGEGPEAPGELPEASRLVHGAPDASR